jgi:peptidoglycan/LPS O-acetylase OafA/YrhL
VYHFNKSWLPGGFIGVDIFFVISGFLISQRILQELRNQTFSYSGFYKQRIKRIMPAMLVVVAATLIFAQFVLRPEDAEKVAESSMWSVLSLANVYFWLFEDTNYFAASSEQLPLLHLWSLGVEEQFYLLWPLAMVLLFSLKSVRLSISLLLIIALLSFLLGQLFFHSAPSFTYYMLPSRVGELLGGAILAWLLSENSKFAAPNAWTTLCAYAGGIILAGSFVLLNEEMIFPGFAALLPTLGTALLIFSGYAGHSVPTRLLSHNYLVGIGLISYSAYLWHWPVLAFYRYGHHEISVFVSLFLFALILLLAYFSYTFIEQPLRRNNVSQSSVFRGYLIFPSVAILCLALICMKIDGFGLRWFSDSYKQQVSQIRSQQAPAFKYDYVCQRARLSSVDLNNAKCVVGYTRNNTLPRVLLWGDSMASHYVGTLALLAIEDEFAFKNLQIGACPPVFDDESRFTQPQRLADCQASKVIMQQEVKKYDVIIISAAWSFYMWKSETFIDVFTETLDVLADNDKTIILLGEIAAFPSFDRWCEEKSLSYPFINCNVQAVELSQEAQDINAMLRLLAQQYPNIEYADFNEYLCEDGLCKAQDKENFLLYFDRYHLSMPGSWKLGQNILDETGVFAPFSLIKERIAPVKD